MIEILCGLSRVSPKQKNHEQSYRPCDAHVPLSIYCSLVQPSKGATTTTNLQKLLHTHLDALDACKISTIYLWCFPLLVANKVPNIIVLPVTKTHSASLTVTGIVVGRDDSLIAWMKLVCGVIMCNSSACRWRLHDAAAELFLFCNNLLLLRR